VPPRLWQVASRRTWPLSDRRTGLHLRLRCSNGDRKHLDGGGRGEQKVRCSALDERCGRGCPHCQPRHTGTSLLQAVIALVSAVFCATGKPLVERDDAGSDPHDSPLLEVPSCIRETPSTCALPHVKEVRTSVESITKADTEISVTEASGPQALTTTVAPENPLEQRRGARTRS
jgi:hypothetical protein